MHSDMSMKRRMKGSRRIRESTTFHQLMLSASLSSKILQEWNLNVSQYWKWHQQWAKVTKISLSTWSVMKGKSYQPNNSKTLLMSLI